MCFYELFKVFGYFLEIKCDDAGIINYYLFIFISVRRGKGRILLPQRAAPIPIGDMGVAVRPQDASCITSTTSLISKLLKYFSVQSCNEFYFAFFLN